MNDERRHVKEMDMREKIVMALGQMMGIKGGDYDAAASIADDLEREMHNWLDYNLKAYVEDRNSGSVPEWGMAKSKFDPGMVNAEREAAQAPIGSAQRVWHQTDVPDGNQFSPGVEPTRGYGERVASSNREAIAFERGWEAGSQTSNDRYRNPDEQLSLFDIAGDDTEGMVVIELRPISLDVFCNGIRVGSINATNPKLGLGPWQYPGGMFSSAGRVTGHLREVILSIVQEKTAWAGPEINVSLRVPGGWSEPTDDA